MANKLTARELEIVEMFQHGMKIREIAEVLDVSTSAIRETKKRVREKLGRTTFGACLEQLADGQGGRFDRYRTCLRCQLPAPWPSGFASERNRALCLSCERRRERERRMQPGVEEAEIAAAIEREAQRVAAADEAMVAKLVPIEWPVLRRAS